MEFLTITGNIGADADVKQQSENQFLIRFSLAATKRWVNPETGELQSRTNWYTIFRRTKKNPQKLIDLLKKGHKVLVTGEPSFNVNTHGNGVKVEVLVNARDIELQTFDKSENSVSNSHSSTDDDDLPF
ncbi:single-stranded DNA-binding protein [Zunongwangia sp. HRR-M8]|uniref:single-stranded DNA-binding protein n=1 Tax=Zunongwangia sp. HRR-M8 TaxID=3015170 RepID=UPI0022DD475A|nr:single-stranded DNA-binding protein [Zunongwangia sp. HRR-M8]WBL20770.1 single-stranded DNA-binding protein [Zunongwangia sp. HRR-M8]